MTTTEFQHKALVAVVIILAISIFIEYFYMYTKTNELEKLNAETSRLMKSEDDFFSR